MSDEKDTTRVLTDDEVERLKSETLAGSKHEPDHDPPTKITVELPSTRRYPVWIYFIGYIGETPKGRVFGNQVMQLPAPINNSKKVAQIEALLKAKVRQVEGRGPRLVNNEAEVIITSINLLDEIEVEETIAAEGDAPAAEVESVPGADQHTES